MKIKLLLMLFCFSTILVYGQKNKESAESHEEEQCGTPGLTEEEFDKLPWVGDNDKLRVAIEEKYKIIEQNRNLRNHDCTFDGLELSDNPIVNVPVFVYVYKESGSETGLPSVSGIQATVDHTNTILANSGSQIQLAVHCIRYPIDPDYVEIEDSDELDDMMDDYSDGPGINIHVVKTGPWGGVYNTSHDGIGIRRSSMNSSTNETLAHEVGHFFTLPHTHKWTNLDPEFEDADGLNSPCRREAVSRNVVVDPNILCLLFFPFSHCSFTGDGFCDTPADPNDDGCTYTGTAVDFQGVAFAPDVSNIMSYYNCKSLFSPMQVSAMWNDLLDRLNGDWSAIQFGEYVVADYFEPNNTSVDATLLPIGDEQLHTLHDHCNRDTDWFLLDGYQADGDYEIRIEEISSCPWPVWDVDVYQDDGSGNIVSFPGAVVQDNGEEFIVTIACAEALSTQIYIKVTNNHMPRGYYKISSKSISDLAYHFQDAGWNAQTEFCIDEDVFMNANATSNTGSYFIDIWRVNGNGTLSWLSAQGTNGWASGAPGVINITDLFENDIEHPVTFQEGVTYSVKLAINSPNCGWRSLEKQFTYKGKEPIDFFFEDGNGNPKTTFCPWEDVYLNGAANVDTDHYFIDLWRVNGNGSLSWLSAQGTNGWAAGTPDLVNITQLFENDVEHPVNFIPGVTYSVKLALNVQPCGWTSVQHRFSYVFCLVEDPCDQYIEKVALNENYLTWKAVEQAQEYEVSGYFGASDGAFSCAESAQVFVKTVETNSYKIPADIFQCYQDWTVKAICDKSIKDRSIAVQNDLVKAEIFPNPTLNRASVLLSESFTSFEAQLFRMDGSQILQRSYQNTDNFEVDLTQYPAGVYVLHILVGEDLLVHKIVKQ